MIREFEFFHGPVFARIVHATQNPITIEPYPTSSNASYILDGNIGIYIKHSSKRLTPWRFSFQLAHQEEMAQMRNDLKEVFLVLVCNDDGIVCLNYEELKKILDENYAPVEWVSVTRKARQMYTVKGSNGVLDFKIGANEFPAKLFKSRNLPVRSSFLSWLSSNKKDLEN
jgi:hypothetical protein